MHTNLEASKKLQIELLPKQNWFMGVDIGETDESVVLYVASHAPEDLTHLKPIVAPYKLFVRRSPKQILTEV